MHERAAVTAALNALFDETGGAVRRVTGVIGPGVDTAVVEGIWEEFAAGTPAAEATLELEIGFDTLRCLACGSDYQGAKLDPCPTCGGDGLVIVTAPEFAVAGWEGAD
jgi:hydrogenase nickel incorporation protein HypA/HybF